MDAFEVTQDLIDDFSHDGVVLLRQAVDSDWIDKLRVGIERNIAAPSPRARLWNEDSIERTVFDSQSWLTIRQYRDFVENSPMAELVGALLQATQINFFYDSIFVRSVGAQFRTPFHQDEPYWSVEGFDTCSAWMPLVPVEKKSALEFVRGSHRWVEYRQENFAALTTGQDEQDWVEYDDDDSREVFPDIEGKREDFHIMSWSMEPGDVAIFNGRMIHGGSGNLAPDRDLKVFNTQWLGDDVRVRFRPEGMSPDHSEIMTEYGLSDGDRIGTDLYPLVWKRDEPAL